MFSSCLFFFLTVSPLGVSLALSSAPRPLAHPFACAGANPGQGSKRSLSFFLCNRDERLTPEYQPDLQHLLWLRGEELVTPRYGGVQNEEGRMKLAREIPLRTFSNGQAPVSATLTQPW